MADLTQHLPLELLAEILAHASVPDILRSKRVNRAFHNATLFSPLIQHKIDLYSTGLEYNAAAGVSLADSREALLQYRSGLDSSRPSEYWTVEDIGTTEGFHRSAGDVHETLFEDSVQLFTLGSLSRGIPLKEWRIPLPVGRVDTYCFHPGADVIAFLNAKESIDPFLFEIHLKTLSDGRHHPAAQCPTIRYSRKGNAWHRVPIILMSGSRLAVFADVISESEDGLSVGPRLTTYLIILDWKRGQVLFELEGERYGTAEFLDDNRLLVNLRLFSDFPPSLVVMDTGKHAGSSPVQTFFYLPHCPSVYGSPFHISEPGTYDPPPQGSPAPFHHDPSQRILALRFCSHHFVYQATTLLKLVESREGSEVEWDEWKSHVVSLSLGPRLFDVWVSGCRLFCVCEGDEDSQDPEIKVYDFSAQKFAKFLRKRVEGVPATKRGSPERDDRYRTGCPLFDKVGAKIQMAQLGRSSHRS